MSHYHVQRARDLAPSGFGSLIRKHPLALGLIALAAGAALGAALPATSVENRIVGAQRDHLAKLASDAVNDEIDQVKAAAGQVREGVVSAVQDKGLSAEALKQAADNVLGTLKGGAPDQTVSSEA